MRRVAFVGTKNLIFYGSGVDVPLLFVFRVFHVFDVPTSLVFVLLACFFSRFERPWFFFF